MLRPSDAPLVATLVAGMLANAAGVPSYLDAVKEAAYAVGLLRAETGYEEPPSPAARMPDEMALEGIAHAIVKESAGPLDRADLREAARRGAALVLGVAP